MPLFDHHIAVDWSGANRPTTGKDSIWIGTAESEPINISTRAAAIDDLAQLCHAALAQSQRVVIGFDFAFGYPAGTAARLGGESWQDIWALIHDAIEDTPQNISNRYAVAGALNQRMGFEQGPFWGHPATHHYAGLRPTKPKALFSHWPEWRVSDGRTKGAHSVWKLCYAGAVGSQTLLGIAALERLRRDPVLGPKIAIWPFETDFAQTLDAPILITEIFPTSHAGFLSQPFTIRDAQQVAQVSQDLAAWDQAGELPAKLSADHLTPVQRQKVLREEGWILGQ